MARIFQMSSAVVVAALALSMGAPSASAEFHSETAHTTFGGAQEGTHTFTFDPGTVHCKKATFSGTSSVATTNDVTLVPAYSECTLTSPFGNIAGSITMEGCDFTLTTNGGLHIICPAGKAMAFIGTGCTIVIPGGQTLTSNTFTNIGSGTTREILMHTDITSTILYSYNGFLCGMGSGTTNGSYTGTTKITGSSTAGSHVGIWHQI